MLSLEGWEEFRLKMGSVGLLGEVSTPREWQNQSAQCDIGKISVMETGRKHWEERSGSCGKAVVPQAVSCLNVVEERTLNCWPYVRWTGRGKVLEEM